MTRLIKCRICGWEFGRYPGEKPGRTVCSACPREGRVHEELYPELLRELRAAVRGLGATVRFTGTAPEEYALEVRGIGQYPIIVGTIAVPSLRCNRCHRPMQGTTAYDGACECGGLVEQTWGTYPDVPKPGQSWAVALFRDMLQWPFTPERTKIPATDAELVQFVTEHRQALDVFAPGPDGGMPVCPGCGRRPCLPICILKTEEA